MWKLAGISAAIFFMGEGLYSDALTTAAQCLSEYIKIINLEFKAENTCKHSRKQIKIMSVKTPNNLLQIYV